MSRRSNGDGQANDITVFMMGARRHYIVPRILYEGGRLNRFYTDICANQGWPRLLSSVSPRVLPASLRRLRGRVPFGIPDDVISSFPLVGAKNQVKERLPPFSRRSVLERYRDSAADVARAIIRREAGPVRVSYTFDRAGLELMEQVKRQGGRCIMEQTVAPFRILQRIIAEEIARFPEWGEAAPSGGDADAWFAEREEAEWDLADLIICGSDFVRDGVSGVGGPVEECRVVQYGTSTAFKAPPVAARDFSSRRLRVLTVGEVSLRKGTPYLWQAAQRLSAIAEFRAVGPISVPPQVARKLSEDMRLTGAVPRAEVAEHFEWADVFLLPTLIEGSAGVVFEAISSGLPVICTPNAGSVIEDGVSGFIVAPRDVDAICDRILALYRDPGLAAAMARQAVAKGREYSFDFYKQRLLEAVDMVEVH